MRIQALYARNFLSFKELALKNLSLELNTIVGPNGSGKSNLLQIPQHFRDVLSQRTVNWRDYVNLDSPEKGYCIGMDIEWNDDREKSLLRDYFVMMLLQSEFSRSLSNNGQGIRADRQEDWRRIVDSVITETSLAPLYQGKLIFEWLPRARNDDDYYAAYMFRVQKRHYYWLLGLRRESILTRDISLVGREHYNTQPLTGAWIDLLGEETKKNLSDFLTGASAIPPELTWDWAVLCQPLGKRNFETHDPVWSLNVNGKNNDDQNLPEYLRLTSVIQPPLGLSEGISGRRLMGGLLQQSLAASPNRRPLLKATIPLAFFSEEQTTLTDPADLASYLFHLKNGTVEQQTRYKKIGETFTELTQQYLKMSFTVPAAKEPATLEVRLWVAHTAEDMKWVPLERSGAGLEEMVYWATLVHLPASQILLLDEPGANLHPDLQRKLLHHLLQMESQIFLVTHSPYMVNAERLVSTHRVSQVNGATTVTDNFLSKEPTDDEMQKLSKFLRKSADMRSLLFAVRVFLVEGESEYVALPIWFAKEKIHEWTSLSEADIFFQWTQGKGGANHYLRLLETFGVPWTYLCDGDTVLPHAHGGNVFDALKFAGIKIDPVLRTLEFAKQKEWLADHRVWLLGNDTKDCFETIPEVQAVKDHVPATIRGKVSQAQWIAEQIDCPAEIRKLFEWVLSE